jgi:uncharacterized protein
MIRAVLFVVGWVSLVLGAIGVFLPILPTTPFILLAAVCFAKASPRTHAWLLANPVFGHLIKEWQDHGVIRLPTKCIATFFILVSFGSLTLWSKAPLTGKILLDCIALGVLGFIWSRPSAKVMPKQE